MESQDPFEIIGLHRFHGVDPSITLIEGRRSFGWNLLEYLRSGPWEDQVIDWRCRLDAACDACVDELDAVRKARKSLFGPSGDKHNVRWLELPRQTIEDLAVAVGFPGSSARFATQLSNVLKIDWGDQYPILSIDDAQMVNRVLGSGNDQILDGLRSFKIPVVAWAPEKEEQVCKVARAVRKLLQAAEGYQCLSLLVRFDALPGCTQVEHITDIWWHPLMSSDWKDVVSDIKLLHPPSHIVTSGAHSPMHVQKGLALFTLGGGGEHAKPTMHLRASGACIYDYNPYKSVCLLYTSDAADE